VREIILIAHNLRSAHNVGSLLRTCEGLGVKKLYLTGYSPFPLSKHDHRLPHIALKVHKQIQKTALGAELSQTWECRSDIEKLLGEVEKAGYKVIALEQTSSSADLSSFKAPSKVALIIGNEVEGIEKYILEKITTHLDIPMKGKKESFNVVQAASMALYEFTYH
jgi:23S rRNA (guanosine2251-2'-O)-methyltransferase